MVVNPRTVPRTVPTTVPVVGRASLDCDIRPNTSARPRNGRRATAGGFVIQPLRASGLADAARTTSLSARSAGVGPTWGVSSMLRA